jgi:hypothetical protein
MRASDTPDTAEAPSRAMQGGAEGAAPTRPPERGGVLRRLFSRLAADPVELEAEDLKAAIPGSGATPIVDCRDRETVCVVGTLRTVTFRPRAGVPALEAELWDGTAAVTVVFLGRREIPGIDPGRTIKLRGRITYLRGQRAIYNPVYELRPGAAE